MESPLKPIAPEHVSAWLHQQQEQLQDALRHYGDLVNSGKEVITKADGKEEIDFTGKGLCTDASLAVVMAGRKKFGLDAAIYPVLGSYRKEAHDEKRHSWVRFEGKDRKVYFADVTYGQVVKKTNELVIGDLSQEKDIFTYVHEPYPLIRPHYVYEENFSSWKRSERERKALLTVYQSLLNTVK